MMNVSRLVWFSLVVLLAGCGTTVQTNYRTVPALERRPVLPREAGFSKGMPAAEAARALEDWAGSDVARLGRASALILQQARSRPVARTEEAAGFALMAARLAWEGLVGSGVPADRWMKDARTEPVLKAYNGAVGTFVGLVAPTLVEGELKSVVTPAGVVKIRVDFPRRYPAGYYDRLLLSDKISMTGFRSRVFIDGLGVALVGIREQRKDRMGEMDLFPRCGVASALSCTMEFPSDGVAEVGLLDSKHHDMKRIEGSDIALSADFTAPLAFSFGGANDLLLGIRNFFNVGLGTNDAGIYLGEPYDPSRIPVLLIHGMSSSPIVWRNVANEAMRDPKVRRNFQFLYAYYSTGAPVTFSAAQIKSDVGLIRKTYGGGAESRGRRDMTLVGYSMGGVIAQILVTDIQDRLWNAVSTKPFEEVKFDPEDVPYLKEYIFWTPLKDVQQVIFIATPHRGTRMAELSYARVANWLIRLPGDFVQFQNRVFSALGDALQGASIERYRITGLDGLSESSPLFRALDGVPFEKGVKYYSIIGDRGKGDTPDSTDGIVAYWSSHLPGAQSELIVPTGHDAQAYPGTEQEIFRILRQDLSRGRR